MTLAQVVYNISTDSDFAAQWQSDPEGALAKRGLTLSREEMAFLSAGLKRKSHDNLNIEDLSIRAASSWAG